MKHLDTGDQRALGTADHLDRGAASASVTTTRIGKDAAGYESWGVQQKVTIGGLTEQRYGTDSLQRDGSWKNQAWTNRRPSGHLGRQWPATGEKS